MTSFRQIEGNRRNALRSTGPNTEDGKRRSRQNAVRCGLCAETVIEIVEDADDYSGFEAAVIADYDAQTVVERELVLRLALLLRVCVAPLQSRPICFGFKPRFCAIANIDASRSTNLNSGSTCSIASSTLRFRRACAAGTPSAMSAITL